MPTPYYRSTEPGQVPEFLTVREVATRMRVSKMTVYRLVNNQTLPHVEVGRSIRIPSAALERYLASFNEEQTDE